MAYIEECVRRENVWRGLFCVLAVAAGCASVSGPRTLSDAEFNDFVKRKGFVLVRFDAGLTEREAFFEALKELGRDVYGAVCPISRCGRTVVSQKIMKLPAYLLFYNGRQLTRRVGRMSKEELVMWVRRHMEAVRVERR